MQGGEKHVGKERFFAVCFVERTDLIGIDKTSRVCYNTDMAFSLDKIFTTRTALPKNGGVIEILPASELRPYVRCFWTYRSSDNDNAMRVIPDCCADIIFDIDNGGVSFVGAGFDSFTVKSMPNVFGIRFYLWSVPQFTRVNAALLYGRQAEFGDLFRGFNVFSRKIFQAKNSAEMVELSEQFLLRILNERFESDVMNSLYSMIVNYGNISVGELASKIAVSKRTLERKFMQNIGVSPKSVSDAIRYQLLWQDCINGDFNILDGVEKYGYYDQAHLYNDFKKYHGIGLADAFKEYSDLSHFYNTHSI